MCTTDSAGSARRRLPSAGALTAALVLCLSARPAAAQTGLALVVGSDTAAHTAADLAARVGWPYGPVRVVVAGETALLGDSAERAAKGGVWVVVPLTEHAAARPGSPAASVTVFTTAAVPRRSPHEAVSTWAARVRAAAQEAFTDLARAGLARAADGTSVFTLDAINVTATRGAREAFSTPAPVVVLDRTRLDEAAPEAVPDLFRELAGLDVEGVGSARRQPVIRGLRGQRVLLLEDGLRLNNVRREVDRGEPAGLAWGPALERVEVVRGPASVLYGSDAIGGVVNLVTGEAPVVGGDGVRGFVEARGRTAGGSAALTVSASGRAGRLGLRAAAGLRDAGSYEAPGGRFGDFGADQAVEVHDTGVQDRSARAELTYDLTSPEAGPRARVFGRVERYRSEDTGFGWIEPTLFGPFESKVRLFFPEQSVWRLTAGLRASSLRAFVADRVDATVYRQSNERRFTTEVHSPIPGEGERFVDVVTRNFTDLDATGARVEVRKLLPAGVLLTYGLDAYEDRSAGTDSSTTTIVGFGPTPTVRERNAPRVPRAEMRNLGVFAQAEWDVGDLDLLGGVRWQSVRAESLPTEGREDPPAAFDEGTVVGSLGALFEVHPGVSLLASVARGFRSPNLVERFFTGVTPNGRGYWELNPGLGPETSLNVEAGIRVRRAELELEVFAFRNTLHDGIVLEATGDTLDRRPVFRNVNVDELRYQGVEASLAAALPGGFSLSAGWTLLDAEDRRDPSRVVAETYPHRERVALRWDGMEDRVWAGWSLRHNGERREVAAETPVGDRIPGFTVQDLRAGVRLGGRHELVLAVENLTDRLYAEALNTGFFRPEPGRSLTVVWRTRF
ncbi:MAG: TonB-dependent receptor [Gemmatimonadetes bacterium]|nr:MAG: TonB-dependent receptor [Gemmatimonadota bacterium]